MAMAQLSGRISLRDIVGNVNAQAHRLYHLGSELTRSNLACMNENKPHSLYEALFGKLLQQCSHLTPGLTSSVSRTLCSLDASTIDLAVCLFFLGPIFEPRNGYQAACWPNPVAICLSLP